MFKLTSVMLPKHVTWSSMGVSTGGFTTIVSLHIIYRICYAVNVSVQNLHCQC